tara:strand:- start:4031 stop:4492 length:462 start_codon:yes stop_codon:yes gene_type:complete
MSESEEKQLIPDEIFPQLRVAKNRLETYPFADGGLRILRDCLLLVIRGMAGEVVPPGDYAHLGGPGAGNAAPGEAPAITVNGQRLTEGREISPGVVEYTPTTPTPSPTPSIKSVAELFAPVAERAQNISNDASGLPAPSDTVVEITSNPNSEE